MRGITSAAAICWLLAAPAGAQTIISAYPPLSPEEAVRILRASHSSADLTDYKGVSAEREPVVVIREVIVTRPAVQTERADPLPPWESAFYVPQFRPRGGYGERPHQRTVERAPAPPERAVPPPPPPPRHVQIDAVSGGARVRR